MPRHTGADLRDVILGGQDGLVNVLGVILAVATATHDARIVIIAGLAAAFAESISMAAVGYTSFKAAKEYDGRATQYRPVHDALIIGLSAIIGSLVPLAPFFFLGVADATSATLAISTAVLFIAGYFKGSITGVSKLRSAVELAVIGMVAALAGYAIGSFFGVAPDA